MTSKGKPVIGEYHDFCLIGDTLEKISTNFHRMAGYMVFLAFSGREKCIKKPQIALRFVCKIMT